jgi:hypothetical protein
MSYGAVNFYKGCSSDNDTSQHNHEQKKAKRSGEGGFGGLPRLRQSNFHASQRRPSRGLRPGRALRRIWGSKIVPYYDSTQHGHAQKKAKRSGEAERSGVEGFKVFPACDSATRQCAKEAKGSDHAERSVRRAPLDFNSNTCSEKVRTNAERRAVCKTTRDVSFALIVFLGSGC